jgi:hypothetical protein
MHRSGFTIGGDGGNFAERAFQLLTSNPAHPDGDAFAGL